MGDAKALPGWRIVLEGKRLTREPVFLLLVNRRRPSALSFALFTHQNRSPQGVLPSPLGGAKPGVHAPNASLLMSPLPTLDTAGTSHLLMTPQAPVVPASLAPLELPSAERVLAHIEGGPDRQLEVLTCPSTQQHYLLDRAICDAKAPAMRIVLAWPLEPVPHQERRFRRGAGPPVAIKIFAHRLPSPAPGRRISAKARAGAGHDDPDSEIAAMHLLSTPGHPAVAPLLGCMQDQRCTYLVTAFYPGGDLFSLIERRAQRGKRGLRGRAACAYLLQILDGLEYMHARGLAHR
jgi:serine/threonine protein kinase